MTVKNPQTWTWRAGPQAGERMPGGSHWQCGAGWVGEMRGVGSGWDKRLAVLIRRKRNLDNREGS